MITFADFLVESFMKPPKPKLTAEGRHESFKHSLVSKKSKKVENSS
jgi:hypothetical protein